ncbi:DUF3168 domain-containing protein [Hyphomonas sp.]|uniref:DUF3168 domain-containing protein n=1 Tax=Hyphomonas sp. TaxID=87 RepID=UPI00391ABBA0
MSAETEVQAALMNALTGNAGVQAEFGVPARVYDDETEAPAYPFARLERHELRPAGASAGEADEHFITLSVTSRYGGLRAAKEALAALRSAVDEADWSGAGRHIVLAHTVYSDVMRRFDRRAFRGVIRFRIISEEGAG